VVLSNGTLLSNKSGSIKERTQTIDNYVLQGCAGSAHAQIRQLASCCYCFISQMYTVNRKKVAIHL